MTNITHITDRERAQAAEIERLTKALRALVEGLDKTNWSSWQTTAYFDDQLDAARAALKGQTS